MLRIEADYPDHFWYGEKPRLLKEHRGAGVDALIAAVDRAARTYPWPERYRAFPGPNSNTFTVWVARQVPALGLDLPLSAIGSAYANGLISGRHGSGSVKGTGSLSPGCGFFQ